MKDLEQKRVVLGSGDSLALPKGFEWVTQARAEYEARLAKFLEHLKELRAPAPSMPSSLTGPGGSSSRR